MLTSISAKALAQVAPLLLLATSLVLATGCQAATDPESEQVAAAQTETKLMVCSDLTAFGQRMRVFTTATSTVLHAERDAKDISDPAYFATLEESRDLVFATADLAAVKRELRSNVRLWAAVLGDTRSPDPAVDAFRAGVAERFVDALHCQEAAPAAAPTAPASPVCTSAAATGTQETERLTISPGPEDATPSALFPDNRFSFHVVHETLPVAVASSGIAVTVGAKRDLLMGHSVSGANGIASVRQALLTSETNLAMGFVGSVRAYRDLDSALVCE